MPIAFQWESPWQLALAAIAGAAVGLFYFGGLYWTVRRLAASRRPMLLAWGSFAARTAVAVAIIFLVGRDSVQRLVACLVAMVVTRMVLVRLWGHERPPAPEPSDRGRRPDAPAGTDTDPGNAKPAEAADG